MQACYATLVPIVGVTVGVSGADRLHFRLARGLCFKVEWCEQSREMYQSGD